VAQLGARLDGIEEAVGSNPIGSTKQPSQAFPHSRREAKLYTHPNEPREVEFMKQATTKQPERAPQSKEVPPNEGKQHRDEMLDEALEETFPASDPPSASEPGS
jgi:hypothetical protein